MATTTRFAIKLLAWRLANDLSRPQAAERFGVTSVAVWKWEKEGVIPGGKNMRRIITETGGAVGLDDLDGEAAA
jgi:transcriptional regulator with XRE-family HTH domain